MGRQLVRNVYLLEGWLGKSDCLSFRLLGT
jgi:hypothetical protein